MTTEPTGTTNEADPGLPDAVDRVARARRSHPIKDTTACLCGWSGLDWFAHFDEVLVLAARADVPAICGDAWDEGWDMGWKERASISPNPYRTGQEGT